MNRLQPYPVAIALNFVFLVLYLVCIGIHYFLPESNWQMMRLWEFILYDFTWLDSKSFVLGLLEVFFGGYYIAYTLIPLYNYFDKRFNPIEGGQAMRPLRFKPIALAVTTFSVATYILCNIFDLIFPKWAMDEIWQILLPGYTGVSWTSFFIGLIGVIGYGLYIAAVFVPIYNFFRGNKLPELK